MQDPASRPSGMASLETVEVDSALRRTIQRAASIPRVAAHLGISIPVTNVDWARTRVVPGTGQTSDGIEFFKHGYGVRMSCGARVVDFDLGENGELDGFDAGRLYHFARDSALETPTAVRPRFGPQWTELLQMASCDTQGTCSITQPFVWTLPVLTPDMRVEPTLALRLPAIPLWSANGKCGSPLVAGGTESP